MSLKVSSTSVELAPGLTLVGRSRAGDGTSFAIPELKWTFDCGALVHGQDPQHIFLTHTHSDHVTFMPYHFQRGKQRTQTPPPTMYIPEQALPFVQAFLRSHHAMTELSNDATAELDLSSLQGVAAGQEILIQRGGNKYTVTPLLAEHRVTCYGYSVSLTKNRLKTEYANLPGPEIGRLRKQNTTELYESFTEPLFCYIGDSTHRVFEQNPQILQQHSVVVTECSFLLDKDVARAEETKHTHWKNLKPIVQANPQTLFMLIHFSLKHSALQWMELFHSVQTKQGLRNVHPMLVEEEVKSQWKRSSPVLTCQCFRCNTGVVEAPVTSAGTNQTANGRRNNSKGKNYKKRRGPKNGNKDHVQ
eukprot:CAMPEP_0172472772 /NCGR_PEP_ID=MMETSP1065-20121228/68516_1 /TAXON_ID=265537 /ORGANISM="Amphiprora paludosa, Strain CCMP125" /LENGTH=359 /DNA_ID=CAMNT_0013230935 /DNA_START=12 /DNA_END=1091 /DNA_ORIENTATION=-